MKLTLDEFKMKLLAEQGITLEEALEMHRDRCDMNAQYNTMDNARHFVWDNELNEDCTLQIYDILCDIEYD